MSSIKSALGDHSIATSFWWDEYLMNAQIAGYPKPFVSLMDGIVMGGGVGVSAHGSVRVVTDTTKMAMPEVGIGFIPDAGGTYILSRAPGLLGLHAALTGAPFAAGDAIAMGFADRYVPHDQLGDFSDAIVADGIDAALSSYATEPPPSELLAQRQWIDDCYAGDTVADIVAALRGHDAGPANDAANLIMTRSPVSLSVALEAVRRAAKLEHPQRRAAPGVSDNVPVAEFTRSRRRNPGAGHRQGPQPEMVATVAGRGHQCRYRRVLRPPKPRPDLPRGDAMTETTTRPFSSTATSASAPSR